MLSFPLWSSVSTRQSWGLQEQGCTNPPRPVLRPGDPKVTRPSPSTGPSPTAQLLHKEKQSWELALPLPPLTDYASPGEEGGQGWSAAQLHAEDMVGA